MNLTLLDRLRQFLITRGGDFIGRFFAALLLVVIGRLAIGVLRRGLRKALAKQPIDATLARYVDTAAGVTATILLLVAALAVLGIETSSLAGILAAASVAIGIAWSGLLANFAAGVLLILLRPIRKGDSVSLAGIVGEVLEIGLFTTTLVQGDGAHAIVGNSKAFGETILNYSAASSRRVETRAQLPFGCATDSLYRAIHERLVADERILKTPAPAVETIEHSPLGPVAVVRVWTLPADHGDVLFLANRIVGEELREADLPRPQTPR